MDLSEHKSNVDILIAESRGLGLESSLLEGYGEVVSREILQAKCQHQQLKSIDQKVARSIVRFWVCETCKKLVDVETL